MQTQMCHINRTCTLLCIYMRLYILLLFQVLDPPCFISILRALTPYNHLLKCQCTEDYVLERKREEREEKVTLYYATRAN